MSVKVVMENFQEAEGSTVFESIESFVHTFLGTLVLS